MLEMMRQFYRLEEAIEKVGGTKALEVREDDLKTLVTEWTEYRDALAVILDRAHGIDR